MHDTVREAARCGATDRDPGRVRAILSVAVLACVLLAGCGAGADAFSGSAGAGASPPSGGTGSSAPPVSPPASGGGGSGGGGNGGSGSGSGGSGGGSSGAGGAGGSGATGGYPVTVQLSGLADGDSIVFALNALYLLPVHWVPPYAPTAVFRDPTTSQPLLLAAGSAYTLIISTPPASKSCTVSAPTGLVTASLVVAVNCAAKAGAGSARGPLAMLAATDIAMAAGAHGGDSLTGASVAVGLDGSRWRFGGLRAGDAIDLSAQLWFQSQDGSAWVHASGTGEGNAPGRYLDPGRPSPSARPGSRQDARLWVDAEGNVWLYGGEGIDADGTYGALADLWRYDPRTREWTWAGGGARVQAGAP